MLRCEKPVNKAIAGNVDDHPQGAFGQIGPLPAEAFGTLSTSRSALRRRNTALFLDIKRMCKPRSRGSESTLGRRIENRPCAQRRLAEGRGPKPKKDETALIATTHGRPGQARPPLRVLDRQGRSLGALRKRVHSGGSALWRSRNPRWSRGSGTCRLPRLWPGC